MIDDGQMTFEMILLIEVAMFLSSTLRKRDIIARFLGVKKFIVHSHPNTSTESGLHSSLD